MYNLGLEVLGRALRQKKSLNNTQTEKEGYTLFADSMIVPIESPKETKEKPLKLINLLRLQRFSRLAINN